MMDSSDQEKWIPLELTREESPDARKLKWIMRENWSFKEPFLMDSVLKNAKNGKTKITEIDELLKYFQAPSALDPAGFIFHLSRCGSTTVSQMLAKDPQNLMLSEPGAAEAVLGLKESVSKKLALFVSAINAFSASRIPPERRIFVKFSGSDAWLKWMKLAYPKTPWIFIYREPAEVLRSNLRSPAKWVQRMPVEARKDALLQKFELQMKIALENSDNAALLLNYRDIDLSFPEKLLQAFGLETEPSVVQSMKDSLQWYSKREGVRWEDWQKTESQRRLENPSLPHQNSLDLEEACAHIPNEIMQLYAGLEIKRLGLQQSNTKM
jgi:hypothetical protein